LDIFRSVLFVPGNRQRMLRRAVTSGTDAIVIDLEDAVAAPEKRDARTLARHELPAMAATGAPVFVRVNNVRSGLARTDLMAIVRPGLAGVVHPKTDAPQDVRDLDVLIREAEMSNKVPVGEVKIIPLIETPSAVLRCEAIAGASDRIIALSAGGEDYTAALGVARDAGGAALAYLRQVIVTVAAARGLAAIDTPWGDFKDEKSLVAEARLAAAMGFNGKYVIHPDQVDPVNRIFAPTRAAIAEARRVVAAGAAAAKRGRGSVAVKGRMVDAPVVERARRLIAHADAIAARRAR
jgi:citrate lyase subunit beta/citryl-CoA lyase